MTISIAIVSRVGIAAVLVIASAAKLANRSSARAGMRTLGLPARPASAAVVAVSAFEVVLAATLAAGIRAASYTAAAFFGLATLVILRAMATGRAGRPCGCFGARSRVGWLAAVRAGTLAVLAGAGPSLPALHARTQTWLGVGLVVALAAVAVVGVAVLALAREVGELRLRVAPQAALELLDEGPELGSHTPLLQRFPTAPGERYALAVFTSDACPVCSALAPALDFLARDPLVTLRVFDELRDADAWRELNVPGSPYAAVLDLDGRVLSKGTFNTLGQLESLLATAREREPEPALA